MKNRLSFDFVFFQPNVFVSSILLRSSALLQHFTGNGLTDIHARLDFGESDEEW